jgi:Tol biopolymer transport system component
MKPDGSEQEQLTNDEFNNWFPQVGWKKDCVSFIQRMFLRRDHPLQACCYPNDASEWKRKPRVLAYVYGGRNDQRSSWSPDSRRIAFVSYVSQKIIELLILMLDADTGCSC